MQFWLFKTEPSTYSIGQLQKDKKTAWNGIRNYQARNFLKQVLIGDQVLLYHSGEDKACVGTGVILGLPYPEIDPTDGKEWVQVDLEFKAKFKKNVPLAVLKSEPKLKNLKLIRNSRLSCMPITQEEWNKILELSQ